MERPSFLKNYLALRRFKRLNKRIDSLGSVPDSFAQNAAAAEEKVLKEQLDKRLSETPAEVLRQYRTGARIQPIAEYSVKEIAQMSTKQLADVQGIGPKSAQIIKDCVNAYVKEAQQSERLRLSADNQSKNASSLVKSLFRMDKLGEVAHEAHSLRGADFTGDLIKKARAAAHPLLWLFSGDRDGARKSMGEVRRLLDSPLEAQVKELEEKRSEVLKAEHDKYWRAFAADPARYYSLSEESASKKRGKKKRREDKSYLDVFDAALRSEIESVKLNTNGLNCVLRQYQKFGVQYILNQGSVLLGDEMGLGKTIEAIASVVSLRNSGETHFAVICPASVLINWQREISKHSDLKAFVLHGADFDENLNLWARSGGVAVTNYENTARLVFDGKIALTVVDEAHYIKNYSAARTKNTAAILANSKRRLLMSGTPLENKLDEMVALINLINSDIVTDIYALKKPIDKDAFRRTVAPVYLRRTKDAVWREMPELEVIENVVELTDAERSLYAECVRQKSMAAFCKMRQISFEVENDADSSKLNRIKEICAEASDNGRKVIIFSFYLDTIERISKSLGDAVYGPVTGAISPEKRQEMIDGFSAHEGGAVLLSQILAGGTGLNIQAASIVIMCEPQYKPSTENQAIARAYRIGQTANVTVYRLLGEKTVDERILQILKEKQALFDAYADKSDSGEEILRISETELAKEEFENSRL